MGKREENRKKYHRDFLAFFDKLQEYEIVEEDFCYKNFEQRIAIKHEPCGTTFTPKIGKFWKEGSRCPNPRCFTDKRVSHLRKGEEFFSALEATNGEYELVDKEFVYKNKRQRVLIKHNTCGGVWSPLIYNFRAGGRCPHCRYDYKKNKTYERLQEEISLSCGEYELVSEKSNESISTGEKVYIKHKKCGKVFHPTVHNFIDNKSRCPKCCNSYSEPQKQIYNYVKDIVDIVEENTRKAISPKELDIYVPKEKFAIEYNGIYWHSLEKVGKDYHINKTLACLEQGIKVFHIFSDEWRDKQEIVKSMICHRLKKPKRTIFARKCELKVAPNKEGNAFFKTTHISGGVKSRKYFGLYFKGELVACLGFKKPIQKKYGKCIEISRFSTALYTHIPGAFSKIFKMAQQHFKEEGYETILSYADRRFGEGKVYEVNGFELLGCTPSLDYWYSDGVSRYWRFKFRAQPGKPEKQVAEEAGVYKIFGCGSNIYLFHL
jgi:hypothetical protein